MLYAAPVREHSKSPNTLRYHYIVLNREVGHDHTRYF